MREKVQEQYRQFSVKIVLKRSYNCSINSMATAFAGNKVLK
jgi:hypothetical protein